MLGAVARARALALVAFAVALGAAGCGDDGGTVEAFCATARRMAQDNPATVFDRYDPADPSAAARALRDAAEDLHGWADDAPGDVADDVEVIAEAADELAVAFESPAPSPDRVAELEARFAEVEGASVRVTAFARQRCSVELDAPPGGGDAGVSPTSVAPTSPTSAAP